MLELFRQLATPTVWCVQNWLYADTLLSNGQHLVIYNVHVKNVEAQIIHCRLIIIRMHTATDVYKLYGENWDWIIVTVHRSYHYTVHIKVDNPKKRTVTNSPDFL